MQTIRRYRAGLIGAGAICPHHVAALRRAGVDIVGLCDLDAERAHALGARLHIPALPSLEAVIERGANVIHVLTPPHAHTEVAIAAIAKGCDVLIEKPLAEDSGDCQAVVAAAQKHGRIACVDHSLLFDPQILAALDQVRAGKLGRVVAMDILRGSAYPPPTGDSLPPPFQRAGYPFRDLGVHALYLFEAFLGPIEDVYGTWRSLGGDPNLAFDEWRAQVNCREGLGQVQISFNVKPIQHQIVVHGTRGVLRIDLFSMFSSLRRKLPLPGAVERLVGGLSDSLEPLMRMSANALRVAGGAIRPYQGLHNLVAAFYRSLEGREPPPVDLRDAARVVGWTERVARAAERDWQRRLGALPPTTGSVPYLVTGASGALGSAVVERLLAEGHRVRTFVRRYPTHVPEGMEVVIGNLGDRAAVSRAVRGAEVVIHAGAAMRGGWPEQRTATVEGTRHVVDACLEHGARRLVHISSMSVVRYADAPDGAPLTEESELEPHPEIRGAYTRAKLAAEQLVRDAVTERGLQAVILRPGQIFGGRIPLVTAAVARPLVAGTWLMLGDGEVPLPLIYLDDVVDAVLLAAQRDAPSGEVIQLTDQPLTQNEVVAQALERATVIRLPRSLLFAAGRLSEPVFAAVGRTSPVSLYRLRSALAKRQFLAQNATRLGWRPRVGVSAGLNLFAKEQAECAVS